MPTVDAIEYEADGRVLVQIDWSDVPSVDCARAVRVLDASGLRTPLRAYVYPCETADGEIRLSDGRATFWDTEAPLDQAFHYETESTEWPTVYAQSTPSITLDSNDAVMWLRDPVRPCNDQRIVVCSPNRPTIACQPARAIFWAGMDAETYAANGSSFQPVKSQYPIPTKNVRRAASSRLGFVARRFTDRDALLQLLAPGSPVLFSPPAIYGLPDRYMDVGDVEVTRLSKDHRFETRSVALPYQTVDRPVGSTQGICGSRFDDLCADSWDTLETAGVTHEELVIGVANEATWRTYAEALVDYGTYATMTASGDTYSDVLLEP